MSRHVVALGLACILEFVTGCGAMNAAFNSKLGTDNLLYVIDLDHQTNADRMKRACRNAVPQVSSDLHVLDDSLGSIAFSNISANDFFWERAKSISLRLSVR